MNALSMTHRRLRTIDAVGLGAVVALTAAVFYVGLDPILAQYRQQKVERRQLETQRVEANTLAANLQEMRRRLSRTEAELAKHELQLEPVGALNRRVAELTAMASACGLKIDEIRPGTSIVQEHHHCVPVKIAGRGSYRDAATFLGRLHERVPDVTAASLTLQGQPNTAAPPTFELQLVWYAAPPPQRQASAG